MELITSLAVWQPELDPFFIKFPESFPLQGIRWYGLAYVTGFLVGAALLKLYYSKKKSPLNPDQQSSLLTALILGVFIGGRAGYMLLYQFDALLSDPFSFFRVWEGGMASHGGFIGVLIALIYFSRSSDVPFLKLADIVVTLVSPGLFFGRLANFQNGELWGKVTDVSWGVIFPGMSEVRHPSQLYEAALEGLLLFAYMQIRFWRKKPLPVGQIAGEFLFIYAILRIICEIFREPDADLILGLSRGTFYSLFLLISGMSVIVYARKNGTKVSR
jgi:phosphatidylglycerol---prolipoprotein diacylglyceryl transferase